MTAQDGQTTMESPRENTGYEGSANLYDLFDEKPNVEFFCHYAEQAGEILDIGAGTGRIALPLAERGVRVTCVEPSPAMRREFERKLAQRSNLAARIRLIAADARSFDAGRTFPAAFLSGAFDHFLDEEERRSSLMNIARHLVPDGLLVFDVFLGLMKDSPLAPAGRATMGEREVRRFVGGRVLPDGTMETHLLFEVYRGDALLERIVERSLVGITTRDGVHRILAETGFAVQHEWSSYGFAPYKAGDPLLIVEAVKRR
jgi:SAM-dependent methyltransferase